MQFENNRNLGLIKVQENLIKKKGIIMKLSFTNSMTPVAIAISIILLLGACSSVPKTTTLLEQTRNDFQMAQSNPAVATYAPLEMKQASEALAEANKAEIDRESEQKIDSLAYLAKQKIATTQEVAKQKKAEASVENSNKQRDQLRLEQRTQEANQSRVVADQVKVNEEQAKLNAEQSKQATQIAQNETIEAQRLAQESQLKNTKLEEQLAALEAKKTERGIVITFGDLLFNTNQARLSPEGISIAQKLADVLQQNPNRHVIAEGFTDSIGSDQYNQALSERRSMAVRNALIEMGVARNRIAIRGYGESFPVAGKLNSDDRRLNRRVEIILSDETGKIIPR
jgi:outer membrane protein OmpA-like peptidoglycan-associated protein